MPTTSFTPITEVENAEDIAKLKWWQQGDKTLEEAEALEKRFANRRHPAVLRELGLWWDAAVRGTFKDSDPMKPRQPASSTADHFVAPSDDFLDHLHYTAIFTKIGLALSEADEGADVEEARENAELAWAEDSKGRDTLSRKRWLDTVFELAVSEQPLRPEEVNCSAQPGIPCCPSFLACSLIHDGTGWNLRAAGHVDRWLGGIRVCYLPPFAHASHGARE